MNRIVLRLILALLIALCGCQEDNKGEEESGTLRPSPNNPVGNGAVLGVSLESPGCGNESFTIPEGPITIEVDGKERKYHLIVPEDYDINKLYPLIFEFHGMFGFGELTEMDFKGIPFVELFDDLIGMFSYRFKRIVDNEAILVLPDGLQAGMSTSWGPGDLPFFDEMFEAIKSEYCIDESRVFSTGLSIGAGMSNILGCKRGDVIRGIAPVAGAGPYGECVGEVAAIQIHGVPDFFVPIAGGYLGQARWLASNKCNPEMSQPIYAEYTENEGPDAGQCRLYEDCDDGFPAVWCEHNHGLGHIWPSYATEMVWDFFKNLEPSPPGERGNWAQITESGVTVKFSLRAPAGFVLTPTSVAFTLYPQGTRQLIASMPTWVLVDGLPPGELTAGSTVDYVVENVNLSVLAEHEKLPKAFTIGVMVYVEGGGNPIPVAMKEQIGLMDILIENSEDDITIDEPIKLEPYQGMFLPGIM